MKQSELIKIKVAILGSVVKAHRFVQMRGIPTRKERRPTMSLIKDKKTQ